MLEYHETDVLIGYSRQDEGKDLSDVDFAKSVIDSINTLQIKDLIKDLDQLVIHELLTELQKSKKVKLPPKGRLSLPPFLRISSNQEERIMFFLDHIHIEHHSFGDTEVNIGAVSSKFNNQIISILSNLISNNIIDTEISIRVKISYEMKDVELDKLKNLFEFDVILSEQKTVNVEIKLETVFRDAINIRTSIDEFKLNQKKVDVFMDVIYRNKYSNITDINLTGVSANLVDIINEIGDELNVS